MKDVYTYIKQTTKRKNIPIESLHKQCGIGRTTMYHTIKGISIPSEDLLQKLKKALQLNEVESSELDYYYRLANTDELTTLARNELKKLIYDTNTKTSDLIEFICYDIKKIICDYKEVLDAIKLNVDDEKYHCDIKIINCTNSIYTKPLSEFIQNNNIEHKLNIEHLVKFYETDYQENINVLASLLPLMKFNNYNVFYLDSEEEDDQASLFYNSMIIKLESTNEVKYILLDFSNDNYSDFYNFVDLNFYNLLIKKYNHLKKLFSLSLIEERNIKFTSEFIATLSKDNDLYTIKHNLSYDEISFEVYKSAMPQIERYNIKELFKALGREEGTEKEAIQIYNMLIDDLQRRTDYSYDKVKYCVYTKKGLIEFAKTGRLSDNYAFAPTFNKMQIKKILLSLRERNKLRNYNLLITNTEQLSNIFFVVFGDRGILIEYLDDKGQVISNRFINQAKLSVTFKDFITKYIREELALNEKETDIFIDGLIESYCNN